MFASSRHFGIGSDTLSRIFLYTGNIGSGRIGRLTFYMHVLVTNAAIPFMIGQAVKFAGAIADLIPTGPLWAFNLRASILPFFLVIVVPAVVFQIGFTVDRVIRRLHDLDLSGWWALLLIPFSYFVIFFLCIWKGATGPNKYGDPE
ncbi:MAG: DUF805 domain-containing protein [Candidatus Poribacteria bacterium]|nr:DUF805 domain-containing protein [Candidatus Poribacteria bacterium]MDE0503555.1 DUF805 domain-containing protein [Candidatus Poribacteria bacterium]